MPMGMDSRAKHDSAIIKPKQLESSWKILEAGFERSEWPFWSTTIISSQLT